MKKNKDDYQKIRGDENRCLSIDKCPCCGNLDVTGSYLIDMANVAGYGSGTLLVLTSCMDMIPLSWFTDDKFAKGLVKELK